MLSLGKRQPAFRKSYVIVCKVFIELDEFQFTRSRRISKLILTTTTMNLEIKNG